MGRVIHFEIHAEYPERAAKFYAGVFGWKITKWDGPVDYWLVTTGDGNPGIDGAIMRRMGANPDPKEPTPVIGYVNTIDVDNLDASIEAVKKAGGIEALAKMEVPGVGWMAYYKDTESNIFGMMQATPGAMGDK
jgi:predicted enzyme related to lactoylglutathione lyase